MYLYCVCCNRKIFEGQKKRLSRQRMICSTFNTIVESVSERWMKKKEEIYTLRVSHNFCLGEQVCSRQWPFQLQFTFSIILLVCKPLFLKCIFSNVFKSKRLFQSFFFTVSNDTSANDLAKQIWWSHISFFLFIHNFCSFFFKEVDLTDYYFHVNNNKILSEMHTVVAN